MTEKKSTRVFLKENFRPTDPTTKNFVPTGTNKPDDPMAKPPFPIGGPAGFKPSSGSSGGKAGGNEPEGKK